MTSLLIRHPLLSSLVAGFLLFMAVPAVAKPIRLTLLHVNDVYEYAPREGWGGLAELATLVDAERARNVNSLFTFGGDLLSPSLASNVTKGQHMLEFANALGFDAAVLGNHEFDFGTANLSKRLKDSRFPWLVANMSHHGESLAALRPHIIKEVGGIKIGLFGILTTKTAHLSAHGDITLTPELPAAQSAADDLRREGADIVIALTHLGLAQDLELARNVKGVDVILGGHDHDPVGTVENGVLVLKAGADAHWLAVVDLSIDRNAESKAVTIAPPEWRFVSTAGIPPSPRLAPLVRAQDDLFGATLDHPLGHLGSPMDSRTTLVRTEETAIGNLIADALRSRLSTDIAFINGGGIRANRRYAAGMALTLRHLLTEMPFGNVIMAEEVSGAQLLEILEHGLSGIEDKAGRFPQVSGMTLTYDPKAPPGSRVLAVSIGGRPMDSTATYRLATTNYLAKGGDGYAPLKQAKVIIDAEGGPLLANVVADFVASAVTVSPKVEGRIKAAAPGEDR